MRVKRGDIFLADLNNNGDDNSEQQGVRPVLIYSGNSNNRFCDTVQEIPISGALKDLCVHVYIEGCGLSKPSMICAEQIRTISKNRLKKKIGMITAEYMELVDDAVDIQFGRKRAPRTSKISKEVA